jgi:endonuclease/exonuclease/phosphatase family metal-dependent hydrolase
MVREIPADAPLIVAGDFNDWGDQIRAQLETVGLRAWEPGQHKTFPSLMPLVQFDYVYARGLQLLGVHVPRGRVWWRMSDHLPLIAEFGLSP